MRLTPLLLSVCLVVGLLAPGSATAQLEKVEERVYIVGASGTSSVTTVDADGETIYVIGAMRFDLRDQGQVDVYDELEVTIEDQASSAVAVFYSFHDPDHFDESFFGGAGSALVSGSFCGEATLEIPEGATMLRLVVNSLENADEIDCLPGAGTTGLARVAYHVTEP